MTTQHTPGPWVVGTYDGHTTFQITGPRGSLPYIAEIPAGRFERSANARLIAAAPDMLKALQLIYANAGESPEWIRSRIESVITRATA